MANLTFDILARDRASATFDKLGRKTKQTSDKFAGLKTIAAGAGIAIGAALIKIGKDSVTAFAEAEQSQAKLEDAFKRFPKLADNNTKALQKSNEAMLAQKTGFNEVTGAAGITIEALRAYNTELAKKTRFDDDALASGQAVLAQFSLTGQQIKDLTPLVADYAAKTGKDLPTAAKTLGKAFLGNTRALKELGINYVSTGSHGKDVANITDLLRKKVGGFAEKEGKTAAGQAAILSNQFGELEETIGSKLIPVLLKLATAGLAVVDFISRNQAVILPLVAVVGTLIVAIKAWMIVQAALNVLLTANPIGVVIVAIAALVVGLVVAYKKSETFRKIVNSVFKTIGLSALFMAKIVIQALRFILNVYLTWVGLLISGAAKAFGWVPGLGGKLRTAAKAFESFKDATIRSLDKAAGKVDELDRKLRGLPTKKTFVYSIHVVGEAALSSVGSAAGRAQRRQHGGPVYGGRSYWVGERGPELLTMGRGSGHVSPNGSVTPSSGPMRLHPADIRALGEVMGRVVLAGIGAAASGSARRADLYARAG